MAFTGSLNISTFNTPAPEKGPPEDRRDEMAEREGNDYEFGDKLSKVNEYSLSAALSSAVVILMEWRLRLQRWVCNGQTARQSPLACVSLGCSFPVYLRQQLLQ